MEAVLDLSDPAALESFARRLAGALREVRPLPHLLLRGPLGSGKTFLVRALVAALPGGEHAEVGSPSFNLFNIYPTSPETIHVDLYRTAPDRIDDHVLEFLEQHRRLVAVEWAENLPGNFRQEHCLTLEWPADRSRKVRLRACGSGATALALFME